MKKFVDKTDKEKGVLALVLLAVVFASMGLFARYLSISFSLYQQVYLRMAAAFVLSALVFGRDVDYSKFKKVSSRDWFLIIFRATSFSLFGIVLFTQAIILTKYSNVSFISALPMLAVLGFILLHERFTMKKFWLIMLAFVGVMLISVKDYSNIFDWKKGEVLTLVSNFFFGLSYIARKWQSDFLNNKELTVVNFFVASIVVLTFSLFRGDGIPSQGWNMSVMVAVLGAGLFNVFNTYLTNYGFQKVEAVLAGNILTLEVLFAVFFGFIFYQEIPLLSEFIGGLIIITSVIGMNNLEKKKPG